MVEEKVCRWCGKLKPAAEFSKWAAHATGLQCWCKVCVAAHRRGEPGEKQYQKELVNRTPAFMQPFGCPTCGCGFETQKESEDCCPPIQVPKQRERHDRNPSVILENRYRWACKH